MRNRWYICLGMLLSLAACEHEIPYDGEYQDAGLVVQSLAVTGSDSLTCYIGRSYFFLEPKPATPEAPDNLTVTLRSPSREYTVVSDSVSGREHHLRLSQPIRAGDTLELQVSHPVYGTARAKEPLLPDFKPQILSAVWERGSEYEDNTYRITMRLPDYPVAQKEVRMQCTTYITLTTIRPHAPHAGEDMHFDHLDTVVRSMENHGMQLSDRYMSELKFKTGYPAGTELAWSVPIGFLYDTWRGEEPFRFYDTYTLDSCHVEFEINSDAYDLYTASMRNYLELENRRRNDNTDSTMLYSNIIGKEESASVYSNIENGFGIWMSKTKTKIKIK